MIKISKGNAAININLTNVAMNTHIIIYYIIKINSIYKLIVMKMKIVIIQTFLHMKLKKYAMIKKIYMILI